VHAGQRFSSACGAVSQVLVRSASCAHWRLLASGEEEGRAAKAAPFVVCCRR
jgi:hypothetical protein